MSPGMVRYTICILCGREIDNPGDSPSYDYGGNTTNLTDHLKDCNGLNVILEKLAKILPEKEEK